MMNPIARYISKLIARWNTPVLSSPKQQMGRWNVEYCDRMVRKIDLANYDNCGTCYYVAKTDLKTIR